MESMPQVDPPHIPELPKQRPAIFPQVSKRAIPFFRHGVPIDADAADILFSEFSPLGLGTQHGNLISGLMKGAGFLRYARVERDRCVFNYNKNFFLHLNSLRLAAVGVRWTHKSGIEAIERPLT